MGLLSSCRRTTRAGRRSIYAATCKASGEAVAIKLIERGARANVRVLRSELVNHCRLDGHPHIIGLKVGLLSGVPHAGLDCGGAQGEPSKPSSVVSAVAMTP